MAAYLYCPHCGSADLMETNNPNRVLCGDWDCRAFVDKDDLLLEPPRRTNPFFVAIAAFAALVIMFTWLDSCRAPAQGTGPVRYCVEVGERLDCYLPGDVPAGAKIVWSGRESEIPK